MSTRATKASTARATRTTKATGSAMPPPPTPTAPKRTTRAAAKAATTTKDPPSAASTTATKTVRKPLLTRNNTQESVSTPKPRSKAATPAPAPRITINGSAATGKPALTKQASAATVSDILADKEPVKAYLRIRPHAQDYEDSSTPYLTALSPTSVEMVDPSPGSRLRLGSRATYTFSRVFAPETTQSDFFRDTTLPLVRGVLDGESGLLFTYGVTNSGKTYTIQGADGPGEAGLLPRTLDVLFNSIEGLQSNAPFKPVRLNDVEYDPALDSSRNSHLSADSTLSQPYDFSTLKADQTMLGGLLVDDPDVSDVDDTALKVDRNYEYAIWISYAEVYNEKIFDLLGDQSSSASASTGSTSSTSTLGPSTSSSFFSSFSSFASTTSLAALSSASSENPLLLKRRALTLKNDPDGGKYIAGLREVRVRSREEAKAVVRLGQLNRRVFGTLANSASSRSHGIFTAKVVRVHGGSPNDKDSIHTARLSIVDLAGSERTKNTQNTGERLKEAGNINKSLMVLGQCMEILRSNQRRIATASGNHGALRMAVVPFRHSKLTEIFMDFFVGGGRAVMIVNVNPYDTGFDENSHVMKFASLARDVSTSTAKRGPANVLNAPTSRPSTTRRVTVSVGGGKGKRGTEAHLEIVEEDEEATAVEEEDEPLDGLVEALFEQLQEMRVKLYEAELRAATIESDVREEIIAEMEERMNTMSRMHTQRLMTEMEENELKTDRKIDMLQRAGLFSEPHHRAPKAKTASRAAKQEDDDDSEDEVGSLLSDASRVEEEGETFDLGADSDSNVPDDDESGASDVPPSSPTPATPKARKKTLPQEVRVSVKRESTGSEVIGLLPTDNEEDDAETSQTEDEDDEEVEGSEDEDEAGDDVNETYEEGEDDEEDEDQYPRSMVDDADADADADDSIMWENSFRPSTGSEFSASGLSMDGGSEFSGSPSPSPPPTVKRVPAKKSLSIVKPKRAASSRAVRVEEESEDELLLSPPPPKRATRSSNRMK